MKTMFRRWFWRRRSERLAGANKVLLEALLMARTVMASHTVSVAGKTGESTRPYPRYATELRLIDEAVAKNREAVRDEG